MSTMKDEIQKEFAKKNSGNKPKPALLVDQRADFGSTYQDAREEIETKLTGISADLKPPSKMGRIAKREWRRLLKIYNEVEENTGVKLLNDLDRQILACYCEAVAAKFELEVMLNKTQAEYKNCLTLEDIKDKIKITGDLLKLIEKQKRLMLSIGDHLMLTPLARARMGVALVNLNKKAKDENAPPTIEEFLAEEF